MRPLVWVNRAIIVLSAIALICAALVLCYSATIKVFKLSTSWQEELAAFLLVGVTFMSGAWVQSTRGHVAIEALTSILPKRINGIRLWFCDLVSLLFCGFFAWKAWTLTYEAYTEGYVNASVWAPPLWIPYLTMTLGMGLLSLQIAVQMIPQLNRPHQP